MDATTLSQRRHQLRTQVPDGALLLLGQQDTPRNYLANPYPFRQDSSFLYYLGVDLPGFAAVIEPDGKTCLYGPPSDPDDLIWHGPHPVLQDHARASGVEAWEALPALAPRLAHLRDQGVAVHYLPPYRADRAQLLSELTATPLADVAAQASPALIHAVVAQRAIKTEAEVAEIEEALEISREMYEAAYPLIRPGRVEREIAGAMQGVALAHDRAQSFNPIVSVRGEVLHNVRVDNTLQPGQLLLIDSGTESVHHFASDITRTYPVAGTFSPEQRAIYEVVLAAQQAAIAAAAPTCTNRDLHFIAARTIAAGLKDVGLMRGAVDRAVEAGAHALFFVHGLGHMLGLDVHDMEDLGDAVGYLPGESRSPQFGLMFLRLARPLQPGFVLTVEPGIYFIPALIDRWRAEGRHRDFIDYDRAEQFRHFGGIRIEDDLLITPDGARVLGPHIPKTVAEVEAAVAA